MRTQINPFAPYNPNCMDCGGPRNPNSGKRCKACYMAQTSGIKSTIAPIITPPKPQLIEAAKATILESPTDEQLIPLLLYRGYLGFGRARALYNYFVAAMRADVEPRTARLADASTIEDFRHVPGLHAKIQGNAWSGFTGRLLDNPEVLALTPRLEDYIQEYRRLGGHSFVPFNRIDRWSSDRHLRQQWRWTELERRSRTPRIIHTCIDCGRVCVGERCRECFATPLPQVWPFVNAGDRSDHAMLTAVDACVPKSLPEALRQDICQDLVLALLTGEVDIGDLAQSTPRFIKQTFKQYPSKYGPISLDSPAPWATDDQRTFGDLLEVR